MMNQILLLLVVGTHLVWLAAVLIGTCCAVSGQLTKWPKVQLAYNILLMSTVASWIAYQRCLLTIWENSVRASISPDLVYSGDFLTYYLGRFGIAVSAIAVQNIVFGVFVVGLASQLAWLVGRQIAKHSHS